MSINRQVRQERTGWRDEEISQRHRDWGVDCPGADLDFLLVEFNHGQPVALVEYKAIGAREPLLTAPTYTAIRSLADSAGIPFFIVFYQANYWWIRAIPVNDTARRYVAKPTIMSEFEYVKLLYHLRGLPIPKDVSDRLNKSKPDPQKYLKGQR